MEKLATKLENDQVYDDGEAAVGFSATAPVPMYSNAVSWLWRRVSSWVYCYNYTYSSWLTSPFCFLPLRVIMAGIHGLNNQWPCPICLVENNNMDKYSDSWNYCDGHRACELVATSESWQWREHSHNRWADKYGIPCTWGSVLSGCFSIPQELIAKNRMLFQVSKTSSTTTQVDLPNCI